MNTKKALNIIILLLLIINIFMFSFIIYFNSKNNNVKDIIEYTEEILKYRAVEIEIPIRDSEIIKNTIVFGEGIFNNDYIDKITQKTSGQLEVSNNGTKLDYFNFNTDETENIIKDRFDADTKIRAFLDYIEFNHTKYIVDTVKMSGRNKYSLKYIYVTDNEILYDLYIYAIIDEYGLSSLSISYIDNQFEENNDFYILPMTNILMSNMVYSENRSNKIIKIDSGYKLDIYNSLQYVWKITFDDGTIIFYDAKNGHEIIK